MNSRARLLLLICAFTQTLVAGTNSAVYLHEGFNALTLPSGWSTQRIVGSSATWSFVGQGSNPPVSPFAGAGQAKFNSYNAASGEQARLTSRAIDLTSAADPFLSFWMYHDDEYLSSNDSLYIEITSGDSVIGPWSALAGMRRPGNENRWRQELISLFAYRGSARVFLSLRGVSKYGNNIYVDEFRVADSTFHDLALVALSYSNPLVSQTSSFSVLSTFSRAHSKQLAPSDKHIIAISNAPVNIGAIVSNRGTFTESSYTVGWRINSTPRPPIVAGPIAARSGRDSLTLTWPSPTPGLHTITAWTILASDSNRVNDTSQITIQVLDTTTLFYESFNGGTFPPTGWVTINRDGGTLAPWFRGADTSSLVPFEGTGYAGNNFLRANNSYLDDYLISPPISGINTPGRADSVIFWTRSINNAPPHPNYPDSLMVLLSTTGADTSSFTIAVDYFEVPKTGWTRKAYSLNNRVPINSTIRVAFRYLLYNVLSNGGSGDYIGLDAVQIVKGIPTGVADPAPQPTDFALEKNYPNPFNPTTTIAFRVSHRTSVTLKVHDLLGREVALLLDDVRLPGSYRVTFDASELSSGVYYATLEVGHLRKTLRMMLLR